MNIVLAIDSFKGCLTSEEVEDTLAPVLRATGARVHALPMSDGGEGMLHAFITALDGRMVELTVHDPLMRPVRACYGLAPDGTAVIETAQACGLTLIPPHRRNPLTASTYGVGQLVAHALKNGCRRFIVGLGGSGTSDAGVGMLRALTDALGGDSERCPYGIDHALLARATRGCSFVLASDVRNPLYGADGAARVFAPQKGATPAMVDELDRRARDFALLSARHMGYDRSLMPGAGAAGGLGYAFMQYLGATAASGADLLLELVHFDRLMADADLVITGEGHADRQTLMGKLPERVLQKALAHGVATWLIAGRADHTEALLRAGFARVESITPPGTDLREAVRPDTARRNLRAWAFRTFGTPASAEEDTHTPV